MGVIRPDSKICLVCLFVVCVKEHLHRHFLRRQILSEVIWINQAHFHCKYAKELYWLAFGIEGESLINEHKASVSQPCTAPMPLEQRYVTPSGPKASCYGWRADLNLQQSSWSREEWLIIWAAPSSWKPVEVNDGLCSAHTVLLWSFPSWYSNHWKWITSFALAINWWVSWISLLKVALGSKAQGRTSVGRNLSHWRENARKGFVFPYPSRWNLVPPLLFSSPNYLWTNSVT